MLESELFREAVRAAGPVRAAEAASSGEYNTPRALLLFAHPDDEVIALGGRLRRFRDARVVHATDGAPRDERDSRDHGFATLDAYRDARAREVAQALRLAGVEKPPECLGIPDQEASLNLRALADGVLRLLMDFRPQVIFTHPYEGGHPDHDACAFAVARAVEISRDREGFAPLVIEGAFYHAGPRGFEAGTFLPPPDVRTEGVRAEAEFLLSSEETDRKRALLACFASQRETLRNFPLEHERYRLAPRYNFTLPPHTGRVLYENYSWGMSSARFVELAAEAVACA